MRINVNRKKQYQMSEKQATFYYNKYLDRLDALEKKGIYVERLRKVELKSAIEYEKVRHAAKGKYMSDPVKTIISGQRNYGHLTRTEAIAFRKAIGSDEKISRMQEYDRQDFIKQHEKELKNFYDSIKSNPKELAKWNKQLGTNYTSAKEVMSNYFFGSK